VDILFLLDIIINFLTEYVDAYTGATISSPKWIMKNYIKGGFIPDFISTTPLVLRPIIARFTEPGS